MLLRRPDGGPVQVCLDQLPPQERPRLSRLVAEHGGQVLLNPARHPCCVTFGHGAPGSQPRPALSDRPDSFSTRFLDDSVAAGRILELSQYRLQPRSLYAEPGRAQDVLLGLLSWRQLPRAAEDAAESSEDEELRLLAGGPRDPGRGQAGRHRGRQKFSREKDEALVRFVGEQATLRSLPPTGPRFWTVKAPLLPDCLQRHSAVSLHTHFVKLVRPRLADFKCSVPLRLVVAAAAAAGVRLPLTDDERLQLQQPPADPEDGGESQSGASMASKTSTAAETGFPEGREKTPSGASRAGTVSSTGVPERPSSPSAETSCQAASDRDAQSRDSPAAGSPDNPPAQSLDSPAAGSPDNPPAQSRDSPAAGSPDSPAAQSPDNPPAQSRDSPAAGSPDSPAAQSRDSPAAGSPDSPAAGSPDNPPAQSRDSPAAGSPDSADWEAAGAGAAELSTAATAGSRASPVESAGSDTALSCAELGDSDDTVELEPWRRRRLARKLARLSWTSGSSPEQAAAGSAEPSPRPAGRAGGSLSPAFDSSALAGSAADGGTLTVLREFRRRHAARAERSSQSPPAAASPCSESGSGSDPVVTGDGRGAGVCRRAYTPSEDARLVRQVLRLESGGAALGGRRVWQRLEELAVLPGRSWQSLKQHWRCRLAPRLSAGDRRLSAEQRRRLCQPAPPVRRAAADGGPRRPYTRAEDAAMLRFLAQSPRRALQMGGRRLWQQMARRLSSGRSWQSLKERFLKRVIPNLAKFKEVPVEFRRDLQRALHGSCRF